MILFEYGLTGNAPDVELLYAKITHSKCGQMKIIIHQNNPFKVWLDEICSRRVGGCPFDGAEEIEGLVRVLTRIGVVFN